MSQNNKSNTCTSTSNTKNNSKTKDPFMDLFFCFTGSDMPIYPTNKINASEMLNNSELKQHNKDGDLIIVGNNIIYVYDKNRNKKLIQSLAGTSAFFPLSAISHLSALLAYAVTIKENGDDYKTSLLDTHASIQTCLSYNLQSDWIDSADLSGFETHKDTITDMLNYGLQMTADFITNILSDKIELNIDALNTFSTKGSTNFPIPFNNVLFGTMITLQLYSFAVGYRELTKLNIDWPNSKTFIQYEAGGNISAGGTPRSNFYVLFMELASNHQLTGDKIFITPFLVDKPSLGKNQLTKQDFQYFESSWDIIAGHRTLAKTLFPKSPDIPLPKRKTMPGDYNHSTEGAIKDFATRLKFSLYYPQESITNCVGFWILEELADKKWNYKKLNIPGLTSGFPDGITAYPKSNS